MKPETYPDIASESAGVHCAGAAGEYHLDMADALATQDPSPRQACKAQINAFGSRYWAFFADPDFVIGLAKAEINRSFRRVILDPGRGLVLLMSPARAHERTSELAGDTIKGMASLLRESLVSLRSARWRRRPDPPNTGPEADCSFYVGARAKAYLAAETTGEAEADRFVLDNPPDLVVEVGVTNVDDAKMQVYQDRGVSEYWSVDRGKENPVPVAAFVAIPEEGSAYPLDTSRVLPGVSPDLFEAALQAAALEDDSEQARVQLRQLMETHGALSPRRSPGDRFQP